MVQPRLKTKNTWVSDDRNIDFNWRYNVVGDENLYELNHGIQFWVYLSKEWKSSMVDLYKFKNPQYTGVHAQLCSDMQTIRLYLLDDKDVLSIELQEPLEVNTWHHMGFNVNYSLGVIEVYVDGDLIATKSDFHSDLRFTGIGNRTDNSNRLVLDFPKHTRIQDLRLYDFGNQERDGWTRHNSPLCFSDVRGAYNGGKGSLDESHNTTFCGHFKLNEGKTVADTNTEIKNYATYNNGTIHTSIPVPTTWNPYGGHITGVSSELDYGKIPECNFRASSIDIHTYFTFNIANTKQVNELRIQLMITASDHDHETEWEVGYNTLVPYSESVEIFSFNLQKSS